VQQLHGPQSPRCFVRHAVHATDRVTDSPD
jgi:hypothetical protein